MSVRHQIWKSVKITSGIYLALIALMAITAHSPAAQWQEIIRRALLPGYLAANTLIAGMSHASIDVRGPAIGFIFLFASLFDIARFSLIVFLSLMSASVFRRQRG